ncbi:hypothetical protein GCM10009839_94200 [Catenulispora yoronensis]|uniref:Anti-sigma factor antagonist n=1 Tax=Catenulispora yoronensis TaxID=450799 RepID=A0ABN2VNU4_9ACTN
MEFSCTARQSDGHAVVTVTGDVDLAVHARFQTEAEPWAAASDTHHLIIDCSGVTFLDSMGLRVLVHLRRLVTDDGREFSLRAPSAPVLRVLELAGVEGLFQIIDAGSDVGSDADSKAGSDADPDAETEAEPVS